MFHHLFDKKEEKKSWKKAKPCLEDHLTPFNLWEGELYGLPGAHHQKNFKDLNVFLIDSFTPYGVYSNYKMEEPNAPWDIIYYPVDDRKIPVDLSNFYAVINEMRRALQAGKEVAVSCYGGHGRTGMFVSTLYGLFHKDCTDPLTAVRLAGCKKWVETYKQAAFIFKVLDLKFPEKKYAKEFEPPTYGGFSYEQNNYPHHAQGDSLVWYQ